MHCDHVEDFDVGGEDPVVFVDDERGEGDCWDCEEDLVVEVVFYVIFF